MNRTQDIINLLADTLLHGKYMGTLDEKDKKALYDATRTIIKKCNATGKIAGLSNDRTLSFKTYDLIRNSLLAKDREDP